MRIYKTADGKHVADGHPDAAVLAYGEGDQVPAEVLKEAGVKDESVPAPDHASDEYVADGNAVAEAEAAVVDANEKQELVKEHAAADAAEKASDASATPSKATKPAANKARKAADNK